MQELDANGAVAEVEAAASGHLLFSRTFFPSWKANVDGVPAKILLANGRELAIAVAPGRHRVEIFWDPRPFRVGAALQVVALLVALAVAAIDLSRAERSWRAGATAAPKNPG